MSAQKTIRSLWLGAVSLVVVGIIYVVPFIFIILTAAKTPAEAGLFEFTLPGQFQLFENIREVLAFGDSRMTRALLNSTIITVGSVTLIVLFSALVAYVVQRRGDRTAALVSSIMLSGLIIPPAVVPTIFVLQKIGLYKTIIGLIMIEVVFTMPFVTLVFRSFIGSIPREIDEAAAMDGASPLRIFFSVILPLLRPAIVTVIVVTSVTIFNDFTNPLYFLPGTENVTAQMTLYSFISQFGSQWNLVDWAAQDLERDGEVISNTVLMAQALDYAAHMADALGEDAGAHRALAERLREAVNRYGWSDTYQGYMDTVRDQTAYARYQKLCGERGIIPDSLETFQNKLRISEPTNTLMLLCNAVPPERREAVMRFVLAAKAGKFIGSSPWQAALDKTDEVVPVGSPWFLFFTLETLFREGLANDALTIVREQWNRMLEKGATTFWETFPGINGSGHWSRSLCHGWSAAPAYFLSTQVLGVQPAAPGYTRIRIAPQPYNLQWASGIVQTPLGPVTVSWHINDEGRLDLQYDAPEGCEVEVVLPQTVH